VVCGSAGTSRARQPALVATRLEAEVVSMVLFTAPAATAIEAQYSDLDSVALSALGFLVRSQRRVTAWWC
jgi:hypothetical protein